MRAGAIITAVGLSGVSLIALAYAASKALNKASSNIPDWASIIEAEEAAALAEYHQFAGVVPHTSAGNPRSSRIPSAGTFFHGHLCTCCEGDGWRTAFPVVPPFHEAGYDD